MSDHAGKAFVSKVKNAIEPQYVKHMPVDQHGAVALRCTDSATHIIATSIVVASLLKLSIIVLFVDLFCSYGFIGVVGVPIFLHVFCALYHRLRFFFQAWEIVNN